MTQMTKDDFIQKLSSYYEDDVNVATLIEIIFDYDQGAVGDDPSDMYIDMYIKRLVSTIDFDWGAQASRDIFAMIKQVYPHIEFPESLVSGLTRKKKK